MLWLLCVKCLRVVWNVDWMVVVVLDVEISSWFGVIMMFMKFVLCRWVMMEVICWLVGVYCVVNCVGVRNCW